MIDRNVSEILCAWRLVDGRPEGNEGCRRIEELVRHGLREMARDSSGWDVLYLDPDDGRLWELTYPHSEMHGGGPPLLRVITSEKARTKYVGAWSAKKDASPVERTRATSFRKRILGMFRSFNEG